MQEKATWEDSLNCMCLQQPGKQPAFADKVYWSGIALHEGHVWFPMPLEERQKWMQV